MSSHQSSQIPIGVRGDPDLVGIPSGPVTSSRLDYIDWMRGLACVLMFQWHSYESWLGGAARETTFFHWAALGGTFPAPLFLFLSGISFGLVTHRLRSRGAAPAEIARQTIARGAEIFSLGLLFRVQEFALGWRWAPWTDLLRVDVLNIIGLSMMLMGVMCYALRGRAAGVAGGIAVALAIALATPPLWSTMRPSFLPWFLESYVNGVHTQGTPQFYLFPVFPWTGFAFAGLAVGFLLTSRTAREKPAAVVAALGGLGALLVAVGLALDAAPWRLYASYDFWHSSPEFFLIRCGFVLLLMFLAFAWCRWGAGTVGFSPIIQLGHTSLLVYWVHIEFVYGRFSLLPKKACGIGTASVGLASVFLGMLMLSLVRTHLKKK
ncbi:MAG TPA: heparan-alpha-glucosaminide N-acetyltransferase domain-containing protein [Candidatus Acidoferrales bacterium]|nr:heparan-alpha-glucosaminide N-acetyltransferase domain-containing protein [Candidatus Acidoferrales bacterium]